MLGLKQVKVRSNVVFDDQSAAIVLSLRNDNKMPIDVNEQRFFYSETSLCTDYRFYHCANILLLHVSYVQYKPNQQHRDLSIQRKNKQNNAIYIIINNWGF